MNSLYFSSIKTNSLTTKPSSAIRLLLMVLLFTVSFVNMASAQTNTWDGSTNNNWNTAANWSLNLVPTAAHDVVINTNAAILVDANTTINSLTISGSATVFFTSSGGGRTITIDNTGSSIGVGSTLTLLGSTGSGTRSMTIAYSGANRTMSIAGTLALTDVGEGTIYTATNSITTVTGTIINNDSSTGTLGVINSTTANLVFASGGTYRHELNGGTIPTATWNANSNCNITGLINTQPSGDGQTFGNLIYDCSGMNTGIDMAVSGLSIAGNFQVINTGSGQLRMSQTSLTVSGNCTISDNFRIASGTARTLNVIGDFALTAGSMDMSAGSGIGTLNVTGNFSNIGGTMSESGSASGAIVFNKSGTQTYTSGGTVSNSINFTVNSGSSLQMASPTTVVTGNSFILSSGATLGITSTAGITSSGATGNIQTTTRTFNTGASYIYNGSTAQAAGNGLPATVSNLTISNTAGATLAQATTITNTFSIATGAIVNLGTFTHTAGTVTLGGVAQVPESWGSTSSSADNKNDTYFAATTGVVNNSCTTAPTINSQPSALTICENTGGSFSVVATGASNYQWQYSPNNSTWTNIDATLAPYVSGFTTATLVLSNTPLSYNANYVRCVMRSASGCRTNSNSVLLTVNPTLSAPTIGTITQPTCSTATGSVVLNGLPSGSWVLTRTPGNVTTTGTGTSTTISGLNSGTYTYAVNGLINGLKGEYFNNTMTLSGTPTLTRTDANVNFNWGTGSPDALIGSNNFSVRWSGFVQPLYSQTYTFSTSSDDGIRLWVNGVQIINNWDDHGLETDTGTIALTAGVKYSIVLEFYENGGEAVSTLSWSSPSQSSQIIPVTQLFSAANCGSTASANIVINAQPVTPVAPTGTSFQSFCSGATVASLAASGTAIKWYSASSGGTALATTTTLINGNHYYASQTVGGCESTTRLDVTATVNATATITPNKVDETCPSSNNGTISPTLSGGLSNVQYIKITQKYADYQQVAEIQAFEIFSGTNVALASNGAEATSSSNYQDNVTDYGPQLAINNEFTSTSNSGFWHSKTANINEYIQVDLKSGKNLNYIRIHNRVNCCWERGQNMLLELFDASNNLVYSKTVNLWEGINGAHYIDVNVLDVSWADGASTLNRTGLDSGTYTLNYADAIGCSVSSPNVIGSSATNNTWNGTAWSSGTPPTITGTQNLVFNGNFTATTDDLAGCSCTVNTGSNVTINSGRNLIITEGVTVSGTGTLTFENSASLVQINNAAVNSGNIIYKRITSSVRNSDYTYWSSPVVGHTLNISLDYVGGIFYSYDDFASPEGWKEETATTNMQIGKGYIIRGPQIASPPPPPPPGYYTATFIGTPNNGILTKSIGPTGTSNLIGNPYPSAIYADQLLVDNQSVIEGTLYFWTHKTAIQQASNITNGTAGSGALAYTSDDYASYNLTGGVGTGSGTASTSGSDKPSGYIAAGQGFFTTSKATGSSVTFNNAMRHAGTTLADNTGINQQFFRTKKSKANTKNAIEKNRVWLNLTNTEGAFKQTLVGYITDATNEYDSRFDGETFDGNEFVDFYSINQEKNLVIQGRALPFDENDEVPLGFKSTIEGNFTISIDETDGLLANQPIFIEDKLTNTVFDLKSGNYTFKTVAGTFDDRFVLRYTNKTLGTTENEAAKNKIIISVKNKHIKIDSFAETIDKVTIFDEAGRKIYQKDKVNSNELSVPNLVSSHQILIVKTSLQNGDTVSNKVIY